MKLILFTLWLALSIYNNAVAQPSPILAATLTPECQKWVDSVYNTLSERQRVAQLVFPKVAPNQGEASRRQIRTYVSEDVGGLLFSAGTLAQNIEMTNLAQKLSKVPVLMTFDGEWGLAMRIPDVPKFPKNMTLGAISDPELIYEYGREVGKECKLAGVQVDFAPDGDVNSNPANPVIGYRSFGDDPERVAELAAAFSAGMESVGVQAVIKHFPGHGDTSTDSHKTLPTVSHSYARLDSVDFVPFKKFFDEKSGSGVMVGHLNVPALDPTGTPASLSHAVTTELLRGKLGFQGLVYTDALGMKGADSKENNSVRALLAGADVLLCPTNAAGDIDAVLAAVRSGKISPQLIEERCKKILAYKYALGLADRPEQISISGLSERINSPEADALLRRLAAASITVVKNDSQILPIGNLSSTRIALVSLGGEDKVFGKYCAKYAPLTVVSVPAAGVIPQSTLTGLRDKYDVVIVPVYTDTEVVRTQFAQLAKIPGIIPVFFVNPYKMAKFKPAVADVSTLVTAYEDSDYQREYAAQALFGGIAVDGTLPVNLPGIASSGTGVKLPKSRLGYTSPASEGMNPDLSRRIDSIVTIGLSTGAFPGGQIIVAKNGNVIVDRAFGFTDMSKSRQVDENTIYDLASVSKAVGTLPGVMKVFDLGLLDVDAPAWKYIPELKDNGKEDIIVRELLFHESGLPASVDVYKVMMDTATYKGQLVTRRMDKEHTIKISKNAFGHRSARLRKDIVSSTPTSELDIKIGEGMYAGQCTYDTIMSRIYSINRRKNKDYTYSCVNFCLMMDIEQRLTGITHDRWVTDSIFAPLGAYRTGYRPLEKWTVADIAPTENDTYLRRQTVHGYVHDETANFSGGVQGNAGLFANANDIAKICQMWLNGGVYGDSQILSNPTVTKFTTEKSSKSRRGLGFDKPDMDNPDASPTCESASAATYGHIGFTGTVFWVDPEHDLIYIFLCNRVNPTRDNSAFSELDPRPKLFQLVYDAL